MPKANHVKSYFSELTNDSQRGNFHRVIALHEPARPTWREAKKLVEKLPKGWYELAKLSPADRVDFLGDFWLSKLPFQPGFDNFIIGFFNSLEDVGIYLTQRTFDDPFEAHMVYSLKADKGFFQGKPPATEADIVALRKQFPEMVLPEDYLAFLQIHDGFSKFTDTGIIPSHLMARAYQDFQEKLRQQPEALLTANRETVDIPKLIPFYESFGFPCYQCFWGEWYPAQEMGNIYYSGLTHTITDHTSGVASPENQTFPTFLDWLMFYLEVIEA